MIQRSSRDGSSDIRFRLIQKLLSDFYLVCDERRIPAGDVLDRSLIEKPTYLFDL